MAEYYITRGIQNFFLDEVHKYPDCAREIKNIYDYHKKVRIVFTGSCITDITRQNADLSRRAIQYEMPGLSYREFLEFSGIAKLPAVQLKDIFDYHSEIATDISRKIKPLQHFREYLRFGYSPFFP